ncbi:MAG: hypothetical protein DRN96_05735 [Thermoproteota archaeon]|nr:MAG: hypothetical protein DRN96_05735 [Candidatus Korarchaeota archaeon]
MRLAYLVDLSRGEWVRLVREFERLLRAKLGSRLRKVIARSSPDDMVYESNVLVIVDKADLSAMRAVAKAALEAQEKTGLEGLSPMTTEEDLMGEEFA